MRSIYIFLIAIYLIGLTLSGRLGFYVNPVYLPLVASMATVTLLVGGFGVYKNFVHFDNKKINIKNIFQKMFQQAKTNGLIIIFLLIVLIFPISSLSSSLASNRTVNVGYSGGTEAQVSPLLDRPTGQFNVGDWVRLKSSEADLDRLADKEVNISGFAFENPDSQFTDNNFFLGRFVITCCAVDATPIGLEISNTENEATEIKFGDWYEVSGRTKVESKDNTDYLIVVPESITNIPEPENPYAN
jgi:uncharacterized repeat protein (TIGR03943 family)